MGNVCDNWEISTSGDFWTKYLDEVSGLKRFDCTCNVVIEFSVHKLYSLIQKPYRKFLITANMKDVCLTT